METHYPNSQSHRRERKATGFTLLELMTVMLLILIVASISMPVYHTIRVRAREAALRDSLFTMRSMIDRFTLDNHRPPESLEELATAGYLGRVPADPFTGSNETWQVENEIEALSPDQMMTGIVDVHSGSDLASLDGTPYRDW